MLPNSFEIISVNEWCEEVASIQNLFPPVRKNMLCKIFSRETIRIDPPDYYDDRSGFEQMMAQCARFGYLRNDEGFEISDVFLAYLEDVKIQVNESSQAPIFLSSNLALGESVYNKEIWEMFFNIRNYLDANIFRQFQIPVDYGGSKSNIPVKIHLDCDPDFTVNEPSLLLGTSNNYFHWIVESISRLWCMDILDGLRNIALIIPENPAPFIHETLAALKLQQNRLIPLKGKMLSAKKLYFSTYLSPCAFSHRQIEWIGGKLMEAFNVSPAETARKRYYITRDDAKFRKIFNENDLLEYLKKFEFEIVCPGRMSVKQQIETFSEAEIVITPHGAGIANIIFAPENATLIELLPRSYQHLAGWMVAKLGRKKYGRIICDEQPSSHNLLVEIPKLDKILQKAIA